MKEWDSNKQLVIAEVKSDLVDIWEILRSLEYTFPDQAASWYQTMTLQLIEEILEGEPAIYFVTLEEGHWFQWKSSPKQVVEYISETWTNLGRRPKGTEIGWLSLWPI